MSCKAKRVKRNEEHVDERNLVPLIPSPDKSVIRNMKDYRITQLLGQSDDGRTVFTKGEIDGKVGAAIVLFETNSIDINKVKLFLSDQSVIKLKMHNDVFYLCQLDPPTGTNSIKTTIIYPATEKLINKYTQKASYFVTETPEMYKRIVEPYINDHLDDQEWMYNILEGRAEQERVIDKVDHEEEGFVLVVDLKWDLVTSENMYCLAIPSRSDLFTIRDIRRKHLPMLKKMRDKCLATIKEEFDIPASQIRVYFHYQPAYYHLHLHFAHIRYMAGSPFIGKSIALSDVIQNVELKSEYYRDATLVYYIKDGHALSRELDKHGAIARY